MDKFIERYGNRVGIVIRGRDETPVKLNGTLFSFETFESLSSYGCPEGAVAILARYIPAGLRRVRCQCPCHTSSTPVSHVRACCSGGYKEQFDQNLLPHKRKWVKFPAKFMCLPVYYRRGSIAVAALE